MGNRKYKRLTEEQRERIRQMLLDGIPCEKIAVETGRATSTVRLIKKDMGLTQQKRERIVTDKCNADIKRWLQKNWHFENPKKKKPEPRKRDWWSRETGSHFRTPYHFPGKAHF